MSEIEINLTSYEQLILSTTRIETKNSSGLEFSGTGFFYKEDKACFLITNTHVIDGMNEVKFKIMKKGTENNPLYGDYEEIIVKGNMQDIWLFYPDTEIDLCVLPINNYIEGKHLFISCLDKQIIPNKYNINKIGAIENVFMIGYPNGLWDVFNNTPIVRKGITATNFKLDYNGKKEFLIDAACFPGSSGSPVLIIDYGEYLQGNDVLIGDTRIFFLGILWGGPQHTIKGKVDIVNISAQELPSVYANIPNNLGFVIKSEVILDFIKQIMKRVIFI